MKTSGRVLYHESVKITPQLVKRKLNLLKLPLKTPISESTLLTCTGGKVSFSRQKDKWQSSPITPGFGVLIYYLFIKHLCWISALISQLACLFALEVVSVSGRAVAVPMESEVRSVWHFSSEVSGNNGYGGDAEDRDDRLSRSSDICHSDKHQHARALMAQTIIQPLLPSSWEMSILSFSRTSTERRRKISLESAGCHG